MSVFLAIFALGILILVHELGHFIAAKVCGVYVERFSIGFGPKLISHTKNDTEYCISAIPLGGYVKLYRMFAEEDAIEGKEWGAFYNKSYKKKILIITAGVIFNIIFAVLLMISIYMIGYRAYSPVVGSVEVGGAAEIVGFEAGDRIIAINNVKVRSWEEFITILNENTGNVSVDINRDGVATALSLTAEMREHTTVLGEVVLVADPMMDVWLGTIIGSVSTGFPANKAGIVAGDEIINVNGITVKQWQEIPVIVRDRAELPTVFEYIHNGEKLATTIIPVRSSPDSSRGVVGIVPISGDIILRDNPIRAVVQGMEKSFAATKMVYTGLWQLVTGKISRDNIGGPILIVQEGTKSAESGYEQYFMYMALISINLGILNILPIPILDGGYVVMFTYELIRRKRLSARLRGHGQVVGMALLGFLMVFAFFNDIIRFLK